MPLLTGEDCTGSTDNKVDKDQLAHQYVEPKRSNKANKALLDRFGLFYFIRCFSVYLI